MCLGFSSSAAVQGSAAISRASATTVAAGLFTCRVMRSLICCRSVLEDEIAKDRIGFLVAEEVLISIALNAGCSYTATAPIIDEQRRISRCTRIEKREEPHFSACLQRRLQPDADSYRVSSETTSPDSIERPY